MRPLLPLLTAALFAACAPLPSPTTTPPSAPLSTTPTAPPSTAPAPTAPSPPSPAAPDRLNPARHYAVAALPDFWLKGDVPTRRNDADLRRRLTAALDVELPVRRLAYEARPFDRQPIVGIVFAAGDQPVRAFVYRPDEALVYVVEDGIAFAAPTALASELAPLVTRPDPGRKP